METYVHRIIADPTLSVEAKAILVTAEIEKQVREAANILATMPDIEISLLYEEEAFHPYRAAVIPRMGELINCRLDLGKGQLATLWRVTQVEHGVGLDRLWHVTVSVEPADTQTAMHWRRRSC